jgi:protein involved in polysaccharide export with SLBB domain
LNSARLEFIRSNAYHELLSCLFYAFWNYSFLLYILYAISARRLNYFRLAMSDYTQAEIISGGAGRFLNLPLLRARLWLRIVLFSGHMISKAHPKILSIMFDCFYGCRPVKRIYIPIQLGLLFVLLLAGLPDTQLAAQSVELNNSVHTPEETGSAQSSTMRNSLPTESEDASRISNYTNTESLARQEPVRSQPQQELPAEPSTEFQVFVRSTTGQVLPIFGAQLFRSVPSTFAPLDLAPIPLDYRIGPGDELRIRVWGQVNFQINVRVDRSGDVFLPQVGPVHVANMPFSDLDAHLRGAIGRVYHNFDLTADVGQIHSIQVYVTGQARRPGVYTVSSLCSLVDALFATGGPSAQGSMRHILLRRGGALITDFDLYDLLIHGDKSKDVKLQSEDVIFISAAGNQVALTGSVRNPAVYELRESESLARLLNYAGGVTSTAADARFSIERIDNHRERHAMEVGSDAAGLATTLADGDLVRVFSIVPVYRRTVTLRGNTANPGRFAWHPGMRLSDLIPDKELLITRDYWRKRAQLGFPSPENADAPGQPEATKQELRSNNTSLAAAQASVHQAPLAVQHTEVHALAPEIDWKYAVIERLESESLKSTLIPFDLGKLVLQHDASQDLELQPGDVVSIFSEADIHVPIAQQTKLVTLDGEFVHAGVYEVRPGETLHDLVERAGGLTADAYLYGSEYTRESTRAIQQARIEEYVRSQSMRIQQNNLALASSSISSAQEMANSTAAKSSEQEMLAGLRQIRATGRIVLRFMPESRGAESLPNIVMEGGDHFLVPSVPATVSVVGAVYDQNSFLYTKGQRAGDYLILAGGANREADRSHMFIIRADGEVVSRDRGKTILGGGEFNNQQINPGDTIVVPEKIFKPSAMRGIVDWSQMFSQFALGATALSVLK